ncbi:MAG TPA: DUF2905 domain-containing protein [Actinobacteria bacterium]|nr:DUF2905 domain-containing protein [Actinomycetota bacterium]
MRVGNVLVLVGLVLVGVGLVLRFAPWLVSWFGKLPGDILVERDGTTIFIPITSMLVVSILLSILLNLFDRGT